MHRSRPLRLGFVPLSDCAPIVMAKELNLFAKYGLEVQLSREIGWATVRDKLCYGELDAAHALAPLALALTLGLGAPATECLTGLVLSLEGNGITLAKELCPSDGGILEAVDRRVQNPQMPLILGIPFIHSAHHVLLRTWLARLGYVPEQVSKLVVVPPSQMATHLSTGHLDGFCVGEPWNTLATLSKKGRLVATSAQLQPEHPEKILLVRRSFADARAEQHLALIACLFEACRYCQAPENAERIACTLARPECLNTSVSILHQTLSATPEVGPRPMFHGEAVNEPSTDKVAWIIKGMQAAGLCSKTPGALLHRGEQAFRRDLFQAALAFDNSPNHESGNDLTNHPALA